MESNTRSFTGDQQRCLYNQVPLPDSDSIRVLHLCHDSKDSPLAGTLEKVDFSRNTIPWFNALSYVWGQFRSPADKITCNGHDLSITASCHDALQALRERHGAITIWVDAICINQVDESEKARQVSLMQRIYLEAKSVYIWLGQGNKINVQALEVIRAASSLQNTEQALSRMLSISTSWTWYTLRYVIAFPWNWFRLAKNLESLKKVAKQDGATVEQMDLDFEWLHRAWTFQELMLAESPVFVYGTTEVPMQEMNGMFYFSHATKKIWSRTISFKEALGGVSSTATKTSIKPWAETVSQWYKIRTTYLEQEPRLKFSAKESLFMNKIKPKGDLRFGYQMMTNLRERRATNSYDHVYAIHGVLQTMYQLEPPLADYDEPLDLVYRNFFKYLTTCQISFINLIADSGLHQALQGAPSWLSDWSKPSESRSWLTTKFLHRCSTDLVELIVKGSYLNTSAGEIEILCRVEEHVLKVSATFQCRIAFCDTVKAQAYQDTTDIIFDSGYLGELERSSLVLDVLYRWLKASPSMRDTLDNRDRIALFVSTVAGYYIDLDDAVLDNVFPVAELLPYLDVALEQAGSAGLDDDNRKASLGILQRVKTMKHLIKTLQRIYYNILGKRCIFTTENGEVGSGPPLMKVGDRIVHIVGVGLPMALRPHHPAYGSEECYSVVGPVYFSPHGSMKTEIDWAARKMVSLV